MGFNTNGDGSANIQWDATNKQWKIKTGNTDRVTVGDGTTTVSNDLTVSGDVSLPGGVPQTFMFYFNDLLQGQSTQMTASMITSGSADGATPFTRIPMVRSGSILGFTVYGENSVIISGSDADNALTASITLDGANVATPVVMTTGSVGNFIQAKDVTTFNGGQAIGVSLTGSAGYLVQDSKRLAAASGSWAVAVLVEY